MFRKTALKKINEYIVNSKDVPESVSKNIIFYEYLLNNSVAYYYSKCLSKKPTQTENKILKKGDDFNKTYFKTLELISNVCRKQRIEFLLFKTYKYVPEAVDGDIDIIVKNKDFHRFFRVFKKLGFKCTTDRFFKGDCQKNGFCKIEPRVNISFHGMVLMPEQNIWQHAEEVRINNMRLQKTSKELDIFALLLNVLYGPNYLKLYLYLILKQIDQAKILAPCSHLSVKQDLEFLFNKISKINLSLTRFPYFFDNISLLKFYFKRIAFTKDLNFIDKIKYITFFFYFKYKYLITDKLHFKHEWI